MRFLKKMPALKPSSPSRIRDQISAGEERLLTRAEQILPQPRQSFTCFQQLPLWFQQLHQILKSDSETTETERDALACLTKVYYLHIVDSDLLGQFRPNDFHEIPLAKMSRCRLIAEIEDILDHTYFTNATITEKQLCQQARNMVYQRYLLRIPPAAVKGAT